MFFPRLAAHARGGIIAHMARLTLDWIQLAAVIGAVQGLLLAGVVLAQRSNRTANRLLATLMMTFTIFLASTVYYSTGLIRDYPHLFGVGYLTPWVFGPLVYLYAVAASDRGWRMRWRDALHFVPLLVSLIAMAPHYTLSGVEKVALWERMRAGDVPRFLAIVDPFKFVLGIGYSAATVAYLRRHRRRVEHSYANVERVTLGWLLGLSVASGAIWLLAIGLKLGGVASPLRDEHISLAMGALIYAIGYMGLRQPEIFRYEMAEPGVQKSAGAARKSEPLEATPETAAQYERSGLDQREATQISASLIRVMESDRLWKDSELTLADLAERIGTTPHKVSEVLNLQIGRTFYDFVNGYRVREVQRRIEAGETSTRKMLALAMDAGFASKSTFNQAFKKHTSQTPSGFRHAVGT
jgi:AraC-like DNA-binding protein